MQIYITRKKAAKNVTRSAFVQGVKEGLPLSCFNACNDPFKNMGKCMFALQRRNVNLFDTERYSHEYHFSGRDFVFTTANNELF